MECDTTEVCGAGRRCAAPWGKKFVFVIGSAVVAHRDANGALWDPNGIPDPRIILFVNGKEVGRTSFKQDTETPVWNEKISVVLNQGDKLSIGLYDTDISSDDFMDSVSYSSLLGLLRSGGDSGPIYQGSDNSLTFTVSPQPI
jgi:Ca2+-dependent lipid-binding protein